MDTGPLSLRGQQGPHQCPVRLGQRLGQPLPIQSLSRNKGEKGAAAPTPQRVVMQRASQPLALGTAAAAESAEDRRREETLAGRARVRYQAEQRRLAQSWAVRRGIDQHQENAGEEEAPTARSTAPPSSCNNRNQPRPG